MPQRAFTENREPTAAARETFLPFCAPWFGPEEKEEILNVLDSDWVTTGPRSRAFEEAFSQFVGTTEAIAVNSCTAALHLCLTVLDVGPSDAVITSPFTFAATANVIVHRGAQPIFLDVRPDTYNLDPAKLEEFIEKECSWDASQQILRVKRAGKRVRAIIAVHYGGHPADMHPIRDIAKTYRLSLVEDAAHALGAVYRGNRVGTLADFACFSFHPTKSITTGEGGMLTTNNAVLAQRMRILSLHGMSRDAWKRYSQDGSWQYDVEEAGYKYNLTDLASALGIHQLRKLPEFLRKRRRLAALYDLMLRDLPLRRPTVLPDVESAWHLYPVQILSAACPRDEVISRLRKHNIGTSVHFIPLHLMSYYQRTFGYRQGDFPVAESVFRRIVSLPLFPRMGEQEVERVVQSLREIFGLQPTRAKDTQNALSMKPIQPPEQARILSQATEDDLQELLEYLPLPFRPFCFCKEVRPATQLSYVRARILRAQQNGAATFLIRKNSEPRGLLQMESLPWDTQLLGFPVARITHWFSHETCPESGTVREELLALVLEEAKRQQIRYLFIRLPAGDIAGAQLLETNGFRIVDGLVTFGTVPPTEPPGEEVNGIRWRFSMPGDVSALCEIAASSFSIDRFHNDPVIGKPKADEAYCRWIQNSCSGSADRVLVAYEDEPIGFTTLRLDRLAEEICGIRVGVIVLVATSAAHRQRGVAQLLAHAALGWFREAGIKWVEVGTQLANVHASRVYQASGFRLVGSCLTFRRLL